jgi:hypothetical protein
MRLYRFSPIQNKEQLLKAVEYVAKQNTKLSKKVLGKPLSIKSLTIFAHYQQEYEQLVNILLEMGTKLKEHNGLYVSLNEPIKVGKNSIIRIRARQPDPYRMQVGCSDFEVENYLSFKETYLVKHAQNLRLIPRADGEMIEFFDSDIDTLGYVVSKSIL